MPVLDAATARIPTLAQIACFDTALHRTMPEVAERLALPRGGSHRTLARPDGLFDDGGFHGLSYEYVVDTIGATHLWPRRDRTPRQTVLSDTRSRDATLSRIIVGLDCCSFQWVEGRAASSWAAHHRNTKGVDVMTNYYWTSWYTGFGWLLWFGLLMLLLSGLGNWGYTYRAHRRFSALSEPKDALDILDERYARGEISREQYSAMKSEIVISHQKLRHA